MRSWAGGRLGVWLIAVVLMAWSVAVWAEGRALTSDDWQYRELNALAEAGLLSGHPSGPMAEWAGSRLTRFEAASLTLRAVEGVGKAYQEQGQALQQIAQATAGEAVAEPSVRASLEDVARVEKLIEEFRTELVTMGARVDDLEMAVKDIQSRLAKVESEQKKHAIDGYMQLRYRDDKATSGRREFQVRRVRINLRGPLSEKASYRVEMQFDSKTSDGGPGSKAQLRTAYVDYKLGPASRFRMGQAILPWGYELEESVPNLWTGERSLWMDRLFPDQRDIGAFVNYRRKATAPMFDVGIVNGTNINAVDNNNVSNVVARVDFPLKHGSIALSGYTGASGAGAGRTRQDRDGVSGRYSWGDTQFLGEYVTGNDKGNDIQGWYAQLGHPLGAGRPNLLFVKYDRYDEDRSAPDDLFRRWSLGYWYQLDPATRLTFVHELRSVGEAFSDITKWNGNATYLQLQSKF